MMNWYRDGGMDGGSMIFMGLLWILVIGLGIWFVTWLTRREGPNAPQETPRQILDRRFALGELDSAEYAKARRLLDGHAVETDKIK